MTDSSRGRPIGTYSGKMFYPLDPTPEELNLEDIAHGLSQTCRYAGQSRWFYSVARHSLYVHTELAEEYGPRVQLYGLFHDAAEAYITDVPRPIKGELEGYEQIERGILKTVWDWLGVEPPTDAQWEAVKQADIRLFRYEADELLTDFEPPAVPSLEYELEPVDQREIRTQFIDRATELRANL